MDGANAATALGVLLQIVFLDLLLSGDNAVLIALACRRLPPEQARRAAWLGAGGAILFRVILTSMTAWLIELPFLQLLSALPLLIIATNLMAEQGQHHLPHPSAELAKNGVIAAAGVIIVSDATMSIDNVLALAAVSEGQFWMLAFGLALSIPIIVFGSFGFTRLMRAFPLLVDLGAALLGWVAGDMIVGDPLFRSWAAAQAPALGVSLPLACAIFVLAQGRFARQRVRAQSLAEAPGPAEARPDAAEAAKDFGGDRAIKDKDLIVTLKVQDEELPAASGSARAGADAPSGADAPPEAQDDRWMIFGLVALFAVFGLFLTVTMLVPE
jgi:YjbE family integral membrane protein